MRNTSLDSFIGTFEHCDKEFRIWSQCYRQMSPLAGCSMISMISRSLWERSSSKHLTRNVLTPTRHSALGKWLQNDSGVHSECRSQQSYCAALL